MPLFETEMCKNCENLKDDLCDDCKEIWNIFEQKLLELRDKEIVQIPEYYDEELLKEIEENNRIYKRYEENLLEDAENWKFIPEEDL